VRPRSASPWGWVACPVSFSIRPLGLWISVYREWIYVDSMQFRVHVPSSSWARRLASVARVEVARSGPRARLENQVEGRIRDRLPGLVSGSTLWSVGGRVVSRKRTEAKQVIVSARCLLGTTYHFCKPSRSSELVPSQVPTALRGA